MGKAVIKFLIIFIVTYLILIYPKTGFGDKYAAFLRTEGQFFLGDFWGKGVVKFQPNPESYSWNFPNIIVIYNSEHFDQSLRTGGNYQYSRISLSLYHDLLFAAFLIALVLATPLPLKRKLVALLVALILIHAYINFTMYVELLYTFNLNSFLDVVHLSPFWTKIVNFIHPIVRVNYGTGYFVAVLIWVVVCFRIEDLKKLKELAERKA